MNKAHYTYNPTAQLDAPEQDAQAQLEAIDWHVCPECGCPVNFYLQEQWTFIRDANGKPVDKFQDGYRVNFHCTTPGCVWEYRTMNTVDYQAHSAKFK